jgi:hypothetical protein
MKLVWLQKKLDLYQVANLLTEGVHPLPQPDEVTLDLRP